VTSAACRHEKEDDMKKWFAAGTFAAALAALVWAAFVSARGPGQLPPNWHVHDCNLADITTEPACGFDANGDRHLPGAFFASILGLSQGVYVGDPASCPNATDKAFLPSADSSESDVLRAGVCQTSTKIIHLRTVPFGTSGPEGWAERTGPEAGYVTYYLITSR
jgi:hypothetical protein